MPAVAERASRCGILDPAAPWAAHAGRRSPAAGGCRPRSRCGSICCTTTPPPTSATREQLEAVFAPLDSAAGRRRRRAYGVDYDDRDLGADRAAGRACSCCRRLRSRTRRTSAAIESGVKDHLVRDRGAPRCSRTGPEAVQPARREPRPISSLDAATRRTPRPTPTPTRSATPRGQDRPGQRRPRRRARQRAEQLDGGGVDVEARTRRSASAAACSARSSVAASSASSISGAVEPSGDRAGPDRRRPANRMEQALARIEEKMADVDDLAGPARRRDRRHRRPLGRRRRRRRSRSRSRWRRPTSRSSRSPSSGSRPH